MTPAVDPHPVRAPGLRRRLACLLYEGLLVFGLLMLAGFAHYALTRSGFEPNRPNGAGLVAFAAMAVYFSWCWSRGQTLAMKTWLIQVRDRNTCTAPRPSQSLLRFVGAWMFCLPALGVVHLAGLVDERKWIYLALLANLLLYALLARLLPGRQYLHDLLAGTELVDLRQA